MLAKFVEKAPNGNSTFTFSFAPTKTFKFLPGQHLYLTLNNPKLNDYRGPTRQFTIASTPTRPDLIEITTRIRHESNFKQALSQLKKNDLVEIDGPNGTFILDEHEAGDHIFIAGGVGITPFISFIQYTIDKKLDSKFNLLYSNKERYSIAYFNYLESVKNKHDFLTTTYFLTREKAGKNFVASRIDADSIQKHTEKLTEPVYWVCGPPAFSDSMMKIIKNMKVKNSHVRFEKFTGY